MFWGIIKFEEMFLGLLPILGLSNLRQVSATLKAATTLGAMATKIFVLAT